jgi:hypothetical protein
MNKLNQHDDSVLEEVFLPEGTTFYIPREEIVRGDL